MCAATVGNVACRRRGSLKWYSLHTAKNSSGASAASGSIAVSRPRSSSAAKASNAAWTSTDHSPWQARGSGGVPEIGRELLEDRGWQYVSYLLVAVYIKKKQSYMRKNNN